MRNHRQFRRIAKWSGIVSTLMLLAIWIWSVPVFGTQGHLLYYRRGATILHTQWGGLQWTELDPAASAAPRQLIPMGWSHRAYSGRSRDWLSAEQLGFRAPRRYAFVHSRLRAVFVPWWIPFLILAVPTALLWYRDRRRPAPDHCRHCNYNLTGNQSGKCPECGTPAPSSEPALPAPAHDATLSASEQN